MKWEVFDSYGAVVHRADTLRECGIWIDPIFGINFTGHDKVIDWDDHDRVTKNEDGSYTVEMYVTGGNDGIGGTLTVRKRAGATKENSNLVVDRGNIRFTVHKTSPDQERWVFNASRISDGHFLPGQILAGNDPAPFMEDIISSWFEEYGSLEAEPPPVHCLSCDKVLRSTDDTKYQFDNALWIAFHGGYGMFVDELDVNWPTNSEDRWLRDEAGACLLKDGEPIEDPAWKPEYEEERILPGRPDHEAVICHECAHSLCEREPWIGKLLNPRSSHAHKSADIDRLEAEGHQGWDLDRRREGGTNEG